MVPVGLHYPAHLLLLTSAVSVAQLVIMSPSVLQAAALTSGESMIALSFNRGSSTAAAVCKSETGKYLSLWRRRWLLSSAMITQSDPTGLRWFCSRNLVGSTKCNDGDLSADRALVAWSKGRSNWIVLVSSWFSVSHKNLMRFRLALASERNGTQIHWTAHYVGWNNSSLPSWAPQNLTYYVHARGGWATCWFRNAICHFTPLNGRFTYCIQITNRLK